MISLDGFSSSSNEFSITQGVSPLSFWSNAYSSIMGMRYTNAGNNTASVQQHLLKLYHEAGVRLLLNALSNEAPISAGNVSPITLANNIAKVIEATQLDGVSIEFNDYFAAASDEEQATPWLKTFLSTLKDLAINKIIVLIVPASFPRSISFFR